MNETVDNRAPSRRGVLVASGAAFFAVALKPLPAWAAAPDVTARAIREVTGGAMPTPGGVKIDIPRLVESGASVSVEIEAEVAPGGPRCTSLHLFTEKNPQPEVASFQLGPKSPRARVDTRIRMADSQNVHVLAGYADGTWRAASTEVIITIAACLEE